jgi:hypothetical protein
MTTNTVGNQARQFNWQMVHYLVKGGPNDPESASNVPPTSGGVLSWNSSVGRPPLEGPLTPPGQQVPRQQSLLSGGTIGNAPANNTGGILIGTIPQGAWIESLEALIYTPWTTGGAINGFGFFYATAGSFSTANTPGYQPQSLQAFAWLTSAGAANALYSTEGANGGRTAWTTIGTNGGVGPGIAPASFGNGALASIGDIDVYFIVFATAALTGGAAAARVKFTGLEG